MKKLRPRVTQEELDRLFGLRSQGIPLDGDVLREMEHACRGLYLYQTPNILETAVFDLPDGGTGFILGLGIDNESDRIIVVQEYRLTIPWHESEFRWLEKPWTKKPREYLYLFPSRELDGFEPEVVLNHRLGREGRILPGPYFEGYLIGMGREPIPAEYGDRQFVRMQLSIFDQRARHYELNMKFLVGRETRRGCYPSREIVRGANDQYNTEKVVGTGQVLAQSQGHLQTSEN